MDDSAAVRVIQTDQHLVEVVAKLVVAKTGVELLKSICSQNPTLYGIVLTQRVTILGLPVSSSFTVSNNGIMEGPPLRFCIILISLPVLILHDSHLRIFRLRMGFRCLILTYSPVSLSRALNTSLNFPLPTDAMSS